jgi:ribonuclease HI
MQGELPIPAAKLPEHYLIAHCDGGSRGNPGPAGYGVVVHDENGRRIAGLSEYVGRQTNNFAEYKGLIAALEYCLAQGHQALKVISDSELLVRQIKGIYQVRNPTLRDLHARAQLLIRKLHWFSIEHVLREQNHEADLLANQAMDKGASLAKVPAVAEASPAVGELEGVVRGGSIELLDGQLPEGTRVRVRIKT